MAKTLGAIKYFHFSNAVLPGGYIDSSYILNHNCIS